MLVFVNLALIIILTIALIAVTIYINNKYKKELDDRDDKLNKVFDQISENEKYLKQQDKKNKEEIQKLITKNTEDLGENKGYTTKNTELIDALLTQIESKKSEPFAKGIRLEHYAEKDEKELKKTQDELMNRIITYDPNVEHTHDNHPTIDHTHSDYSLKSHSHSTTTS